MRICIGISRFRTGSTGELLWTLINLNVPQTAENFLTNWATSSFSRRTLLQAVNCSRLYQCLQVKSVDQKYLRIDFLNTIYILCNIGTDELNCVTHWNLHRINIILGLQQARLKNKNMRKVTLYNCCRLVNSSTYLSSTYPTLWWKLPERQSKTSIRHRLGGTVLTTSVSTEILWGKKSFLG